MVKAWKRRVIKSSHLRTSMRIDLNFTKLLQCKPTFIKQKSSCRNVIKNRIIEALSAKLSQIVDKAIFFLSKSTLHWLISNFHKAPRHIFWQRGIIGALEKRRYLKNHCIFEKRQTRKVMTHNLPMAVKNAIQNWDKLHLVF